MGLLIEYNRYMSPSCSNITMHNTKNHKMTTSSTIYHDAKHIIPVSSGFSSSTCMYRVQSLCNQLYLLISEEKRTLCRSFTYVYTSNTNNIHSSSHQDSKQLTTKSSNQVDNFCSYIIGSHIHAYGCE